MSRARTILFTGAAAAAAAAVAVPALASDPASGTVSEAAPSVTWKGNATGYGVVPTNILVTTAGQDPQCPPTACDKFALTVADSFDLVVTAAQSAHDNFTELHVVQPDGSVQYVQSEDGKAATIKVKKAAKGDYGIEVLTNESADQSGAYDASATLNVPKPAGTQPAPPATAPAHPNRPEPRRDPAGAHGHRPRRLAASCRLTRARGIAVAEDEKGLGQE